LITNWQIVFQYRAHATTNAFGWTFPLEFYGVQYGKGGAEGWCVELFQAMSMHSPGKNARRLKQIFLLLQ
jgi:hypothetical protein